MILRDSQAGDLAALEQLYPLAFPDEELIPLVRALVADPACACSILAERNGEVLGHVVFTRCEVEGRPAALLGPLGVTPASQKQGVGSALVQSGLDRVASAGAMAVLVLGDPRYYQRFGFTSDHRIAAPYTLPEAYASAWQAVQFGTTPAAGQLQVPPVWQTAALWA